MSAGSASTGGGGGGSPNQMAKNKAAKDKAVRDKEARQAKIREEQKTKQKNQTPIPKTTFAKKDDAREKARSTNYTTQPKKSTFKTSKKEYDDSVGKSNLSNAKVAKVPIGVPGSTVLNSFQTARQKLLEKNTKFFREKVLTSKNRGGYEDTFDSYSSYMKSRLAGSTDAYGNPTPKQGGGNNNTPTVKVASIPKVNTAPTEAEVSQSAATDTATVAEPKKEDDIYTRKRKAKARGRSMMTLTSAQGVKKDDNLILGRRSLLGS